MNCDGDGVKSGEGAPLDSELLLLLDDRVLGYGLSPKEDERE